MITRVCECAFYWFLFSRLWPLSGSSRISSAPTYRAQAHAKSFILNCLCDRDNRENRVTESRVSIYIYRSHSKSTAFIGHLLRIISLLLDSNCAIAVLCERELRSSSYAQTPHTALTHTLLRMHECRYTETETIEFIQKIYMNLWNGQASYTLYRISPITSNESHKWNH